MLLAVLCLQYNRCILHVQPNIINTRGVHKVRRLTQLATRYAYHILSLFNIVSCNWNALGPAFLQLCDSDKESLFFVFQPAICYAIRIRMVNSVGDGMLSWLNDFVS